MEISKQTLIVGAVAAFIGLGVGAVAAEPETQVKTVTKTKTETVTKAPDSCKDALDAADELFTGPVVNAYTYIAQLSDFLSGNGTEAEAVALAQGLDQDVKTIERVKPEYDKASEECRNDGGNV